jgi:transposase
MKFRELLDQYNRLQAENAQLQIEKAQWLTEKSQLQEKVTDYEQRLADAANQIAFYRRQMFGRKGERLTADEQEQIGQLALDLEEHALRPAPVIEQVLLADAPLRRKSSSRRRTRHPFPENLETVTEVLEPENVKTPCPHCGELPSRIGEEISEEVEIIPARMIRRVTVRPKYAYQCGQGGVDIAPLPERLIPQSGMGLGLAVHVLLSRFDDHLSYYWIEKQFAERFGVTISRQKMVQWVEHIAGWLKPIYEAMWDRMHAGGYLQIDETPVKVLDPEVKGKAANGYLWFYAVPDGDVILAFERSRGLAAVRERLKDFSGTIQTDAYEVYQSLNRQESSLSRIGCLAHARRRFYKAFLQNSSEAAWFISGIRALYVIEDQARKMSHAERHQLRKEAEALEIWEALKERAEVLKHTVLPKSTLGEAISYFLNEYQFLTGYLQDGRFEIDNNLVENAIRPTTVGRKRWLFIGHPQAGWRSAVIYSILASCRRRSINPRDYLTDVLRRLPQTTINQIESLLPSNWKPLQVTA